MLRVSQPVLSYGPRKLVCCEMDDSCSTGVPACPRHSDGPDQPKEESGDDNRDENGSSPDEDDLGDAQDESEYEGRGR